MALFIYFDKDFNYIKSSEGTYVNQIELGTHCIVISHLENAKHDCQWFNFINRHTPFEHRELDSMWNKVIRGIDNMPKKVKTFFLLGGLEIALKEST